VSSDDVGLREREKKGRGGAKPESFLFSTGRRRGRCALCCPARKKKRGGEGGRDDWRIPSVQPGKKKKETIKKPAFLWQGGKKEKKRESALIAAFLHRWQRREKKVRVVSVRMTDEVKEEKEKGQPWPPFFISLPASGKGKKRKKGVTRSVCSCGIGEKEEGGDRRWRSFIIDEGEKKKYIRFDIAVIKGPDCLPSSSSMGGQGGRGIWRPRKKGKDENNASGRSPEKTKLEKGGKGGKSVIGVKGRMTRSSALTCTSKKKGEEVFSSRTFSSDRQVKEKAGTVCSRPARSGEEKASGSCFLPWNPVAGREKKGRRVRRR